MVRRPRRARSGVAAPPARCRDGSRLILDVQNAPQRLPAARQARAHRTDGHRQDGGGLLVAHPFETDHQDRLALFERQLAERRVQFAQLPRGGCIGVATSTDAISVYIDIAAFAVDRRTSLTCWLCISVKSQARRLVPLLPRCCLASARRACPGPDRRPGWLRASAPSHSAASAESVLRAGGENRTSSFPFGVGSNIDLTPPPQLCRLAAPGFW